MGFKRPQMKLVFNDDELFGLEVTAKRISIRRVFKLSALADMGQKLEEMEEQFNELLTNLVPCLIRWNLEDEDDRPVPLTVDGLKDQDLPLVLSIVEALIDASAGVPGPLDRTSSGGTPSEAPPIPMEDLSDDQQL